VVVVLAVPMSSEWTRIWTLSLHWYQLWPSQFESFHSRILSLKNVLRIFVWIPMLMLQALRVSMEEARMAQASQAGQSTGGPSGNFIRFTNMHKLIL
jgi:hypothetical protein